ncbi:hypothetical protein [Endozoicomonas acroporae]|uniref:hypothetical protein n=1 Tax=Endozoicomonas acroporae TaxID=1701104 RepID=UPI003D795CC9
MMKTRGLSAYGDVLQVNFNMKTLSAFSFREESRSMSDDKFASVMGNHVQSLVDSMLQNPAIDTYVKSGGIMLWNMVSIEGFVVGELIFHNGKVQADFFVDTPRN